MSEINQSPPVVRHSPTNPDRQRSEHGQSFRIGDKIVRIDAASIFAPGKPHIELSPQELESTPSEEAASSHKASTNEALLHESPLPQWGSGIGSIEMGIGNVVGNNIALQQAAVEVAGTVTTVPVKTGPLKIKPAWEVDYFRWPRLARRLLKTHRALFDQIGNQVLGDLQPTQRRIGVCSTFGREGKTTIAICLARWAASLGKRTLLIDADVERPQLTSKSGLDCAFGWQGIIDSNMLASETMIRSSENGLVFMPSRTDRKPVIVNKSLDRLSMITFQMKYEFDVVIIDMGKIDNVCAHGTESMDVVDAVLVTRDPSQTSVGQMMDTRRVLLNLGMTKSYVAQNFARNRVA